MGLIDGLTPRTISSAVRNKALEIIGNQGYGAGILEVGYMRRALPLEAHLALWDYLTVSGLFLYGNGTSDSHGGIWYEGLHGNWFQTWVWATDSSAGALLEGMKSGRMYFGDNSQWDGEFDFWVGSYEAGMRVGTVEGELPVRFRLDPHPDNCSVRLVQALLETERMNVRYIHRGIPLEGDPPFLVQVDRPCFIRLEVYGNDRSAEEDVPLVFSNPIVFSDAIGH